MKRREEVLEEMARLAATLQNVADYAERNISEALTAVSVLLAAIVSSVRSGDVAKAKKIADFLLRDENIVAVLEDEEREVISDFLNVVEGGAD